MPIPAKPCAGTFSEETVQALIKNNDHAQWLPQTCDLCQQQIGARLDKGKWVPEQHWPSVRYVPRAKRAEKRTTAKRTGDKLTAAERTADNLTTELPTPA